MHFTPEPYQVQVRDFLLGNARAGAFVGVGLGKTAATLSALRDLFLEGEIRSALVVAPLRVANLTWPNEVAKWDQFQPLRVKSLRSGKPDKRTQIYTVNYESLHRLDNLDFCDVVIFDELTKAKNPRSKRINHLTPLLKHHRRWGLTGTPRPNSLLELFAQIRLLDGGQRLGRSYSQFQNTYFTSDYMGYNWTPKPEAEKAIYAKIADLTITLKTSDYLDLPDAEVEDIEVALPDSAKSMYRELEKELLVACGQKGDVVAQNAATLVGKLQQLTGGCVYTENRGVVEVHDAKLQTLKKLHQEGENLLVATQYIHERERLLRAIPEAVDASTFKGDLEDAWNSGKIKMLVADPRSLGHGLNLQHGGNTTVWYSPNYSRELYDQFNGRCFRKGQTKPTKIYRLVCPGTIDDAVVETLRVRGDEQTAMLNLLSNFRKIAA